MTATTPIPKSNPDEKLRWLNKIRRSQTAHRVAGINWQFADGAAGWQIKRASQRNGNRG